MQENAVRLFPQSAKLSSDLAWLYLEARRPGDALTYMQYSINYDKFNPRYSDSLAAMRNRLRGSAAK